MNNNETEGHFVDRHLFAAKNDPICVRIRRTDYDELSYVFKPGEQRHLVDDDLYKAPLMRRGWVLQERLLSRRSVYFSSQLYWECGELQACEYFPDGDNITNLAQAVPLQWGSGAPFRMSTLARIIHRVNHEPAPLIRWESNYQCWMTVVERFSTCGLTVESDCLPALSGLAKKFTCLFKDEYLAGLWKNDLIRELLWYSSFRSGVQFNSREYRGTYVPRLFDTVEAAVDIKQHQHGHGLRRPLLWTFSSILAAITFAGSLSLQRFLGARQISKEKTSRAKSVAAHYACEVRWWRLNAIRFCGHKRLGVDICTNGTMKATI